MAIEIKPIRSEPDYQAALVDIEQYFDREPEFGTPEADRFDVLAALIGAYEDEHHAIEAPDAATAITEVMALRGHKQADLGRLLGSRSRASEIMNRKRLPTIEQARLLHEAWGVPAVSLLATEETLRPNRRVEAAAKPRQCGALQQQIEALRREAYAAGYAAAMQAISEFAGHPAAAATAAPATPAARSGRPPAVDAPAARKRPQRGSHARLIAEILKGMPSGMAKPAEIRKALQEDKGVAMAFTSIRHALGQLATRHEVVVSDDDKIWRYIGPA